MSEYGYHGSKRRQHEPYRDKSKPKPKEPRLADTHWGLFDQFMERNDRRSFTDEH